MPNFVEDKEFWIGIAALHVVAFALWGFALSEVM